ncbi:hypothetical protein CFOL_v3_22072 [Cephalotus follicularis]|uniref:Uncharacterized protein n=1 Tax=Cephalotus follicularis TaxID=3775 RepID=A0A1Q3CEG6_CEPFO|nr:hypothetical protein CFOL_v3_22072 [Cephalotus follicularis]
MDIKLVAKRRHRDSFVMNFKLVYRLLSWRRKASRMRFKYKQKNKEASMMVKKMEAEVGKLKEELREERKRFVESEREMKEALEWIAIKREQNQMYLHHDARGRRGVDLLLDIIDARDRRHFTRAISLTRSFHDIMMPRQNEDKQGFTDYGHEDPC